MCFNSYIVTGCKFAGKKCLGSKLPLPDERMLRRQKAQVESLKLKDDRLDMCVMIDGKYSYVNSKSFGMTMVVLYPYSHL